MKLIFIFITALLLSVTSFAQLTEPPNPSQPFSKDYYLKKSKSNKTAAWILLSAGTVLVGTGIGVGLNEATEALVTLFTTEEEKYSNAGEILFFSGLAVVATSIPFFIASSKNRKKANAVSASLKMENSLLVRQQSFVNTRYPAISLKIKINE